MDREPGLRCLPTQDGFVPAFTLFPGNEVEMVTSFVREKRASDGWVRWRFAKQGPIRHEGFAVLDMQLHRAVPLAFRGYIPEAEVFPESIGEVIHDIDTICHFVGRQIAEIGSNLR